MKLVTENFKADGIKDSQMLVDCVQVLDHTFQSNVCVITTGLLLHWAIAAHRSKDFKLSMLLKYLAFQIISKCKASILFKLLFMNLRTSFCYSCSKTRTYI